MTEDYSEAKFWVHCLIATVGAVLIKLYSVELAILFGWCYGLLVSIKRGSAINITKSWTIGTTTLLFGWLYFSTCISDEMAIYTLCFLAAWICLLGFPYGKGEKSEVAKTTWLKPSLFGGRFTRKQYFWRVFLVAIISGILGSMLQAGLLTPPTSLHGLEEFQQEAMLLGLITYIPTAIFFYLPFGVKRAHDIGHSGTFLIALFVIGLIGQLLGCVSMGCATIFSFIVGIPALIYGCILLFSDSEKGTNAYGTSTKYPDTTA